MKPLKLFTLQALVFMFFSCAKDAAIIPEETSESISENSILRDAFGLANDEFAVPGPYQVTTNALRGDCAGLVGIASRVLSSIGFLDPGIQCSPSFPNGFDKPFSTEIHYPSNIQSMEPLPVINFVGGILSNQGHYDALVKLWASYGFIVVNSNDFLNITPTMHVFGAIEVAKLNKDPKSPIYGRADLSKMIVGGHSMGGGACLATATIPQSALNLIDPSLRIVGTFPLQPAPFAKSSQVKAPTLLLTGAADVIVSPFGWPLLQKRTLRSIPSWFGTARFATHLSPNLEIKRNEYAGISTAWMLYIGKRDVNASRYFLGNDYKLSKDPQFFLNERLIFRPLNVDRSRSAAALRPLTN